jgi:hypothetical protein
MIDVAARSALSRLWPLLIALAMAATAALPGASAQSPATPASPSPVGTASVPPGTIVAWTQLGREGTLLARAVAGVACPQIEIDGSTQAMTVRAEPSGAFPVLVCEAEVPNGAQAAAVDDRALPLLKNDPQRVVAIGDTGCRIREDQAQACNDPAAWPFAAVAAEAAAWGPDLVVHAGDYLYRESPCPEGNEGCAGSTWGDTWTTWQTDFFAPASPLLSAAPWIFMRGNHESCARGWEGWFRLLDPGPMPEECQEFTPPYAVQIGGQRAVVLDAAAAQDLETTAETTAAYREQLAAVESLAGGDPVWLLSHKAFWTLGADGDDNPLEWTTATFTEAGYAPPPAAIELVISGHVHMAQSLSFTPESGRPVELIVGNSGTLLEWFEGGTFTGADLGDPALIEGVRFKYHGFTTLEAVGAGWVATAHALGGTALQSCLIVAKSLACVRQVDPAG